MNVKIIHNTLELPKFMLLFTPDTPEVTMQNRVWFELTEVFLYEAPTTDYRFYAISLPGGDNHVK